jgi:hypothetical protein
LLDRSIVHALPPLKIRVPEQELWAKFEEQKAGIFGALCTMLSTGVRQLPTTRLTDPPRMADATAWVTACGLDGFERAYAASRQAAINVILDHDVLAAAIKALVATKPWRGTAQELLDTIGPRTKVANPKSLSDALRRLSPMLRSVGIHITHEPRTAERREMTISRASG